MYELKLPKMTCPGCAKSVKSALLEMDANSSIEINIITRTIRIQTSKSKNEVLSVLEKAGYPAEVNS